MGLRLTWSSRGGLRLSESARIGRLRVGESIPLARGRKGRRRRKRSWISFRL